MFVIICLYQVFSALRGTAPQSLIFENFAHFLKKINQLWTKYPLDLVRNVPRNSKLLFYFSLETIVVKLGKICAKINIFHVLSHKSITTWVNEIPVQYFFLGMLPIRNIFYLSPMCCNFWKKKCINSHKIDQGCSTHSAWNDWWKSQIISQNLWTWVGCLVKNQK